MEKVISDEKITELLENTFPLDTTKFQGRSIMISAPYMMPNIRAFKTFFEKRGIIVLVADVKERLEESDLLKYSGMYEVALIGDDRYTSRVLTSGTSGIGNSNIANTCNGEVSNTEEINTSYKLLGLSKWGTGIDSIDAVACKVADVIIMNTPDAFSEPVAESLLGSILTFNRTLMKSTKQMQEHPHSWIKYPGKTLPECTYGIVGLGNVGKALLRKLVNLGVTVPNSIFTYDIIGNVTLSSPEFSPHLLTGLTQLESLNDLLRRGPDFLIIACCQTAENKSMISKEELSILTDANSQCVILNMARGQLIDESELIKFLKEGKLAGAALDVFWDEPLPEKSSLREMPNVILSSHNANSSPLHWLKVHINTIKNAFTILGA